MAQPISLDSLRCLVGNFIDGAWEWAGWGRAPVSETLPLGMRGSWFESVGGWVCACVDREQDQAGD